MGYPVGRGYDLADNAATKKIVVFAQMTDNVPKTERAEVADGRQGAQGELLEKHQNFFDFLRKNS